MPPRKVVLPPEPRKPYLPKHVPGKVIPVPLNLLALYFEKNGLGPNLKWRYGYSTKNQDHLLIVKKEVPGESTTPPDNQDVPASD